ncbi:phosphoglycolate phosphatase [Pleionea sp. CnH1-48]|uniref:phosphoglycolate phosphatase n=1 Tax=Pleionea sp. CnH1-48 TaxID=2954494 RepID=UPI002097FDFC|nr:phosphoglycolate phosphatase [Pleionea sp. CnH1-48]
MEHQLLIFDLDGTLIESLPDIALATDKMLMELGYQPAGEQRVGEWIGNGMAKLIERALYSQLEQIPEADTLKLAIEIFQRHYHQSLGEASKLYPGVQEHLELLKTKYRLALCTNKPKVFTELLLKQFKLEHLFEWVVCGDSLAQKKPSPEPLLWICEQADILPSHSLMVGDSHNDTKAAHAATMSCVCFSYGYNHGRPITDEFDGPVFDHFEQLHDWLQLNSSIAHT